MKSINTNFNIPSPTTSLSVRMKLKLITTSLKQTNKMYSGDPMKLLITDAFPNPTQNKSSRLFSPISYNPMDESLSGSSGSAKNYIKIFK